jgi:protein-ribulosamine 3-kinase
MMMGEFESATALWKSLPDFIPRPIAWGTYLTDPNNHFYLCDFHDMTDELPDVAKFCAKVARLHLNSIPQSPNGQYGFHTTTYVGKIPQDNTWCDSWEDFFKKGFKHHLELEEQVQGPDEQMRELSKAMIEKVIPRLLRPLESGGRRIKPCIIHGDLWSGNATMDADSDEPMIFDAWAFWGHNECNKCNSD